MQAAQQDLSRALQEKMKLAKPDRADTFLELLGYDVDSSYRETMSYHVSAAVSELSIAGQTVQAGNVQINIRDENVLLSVDRSCIAFDFTCTGNVPDNILQAFQPINCQLGQMSWAVGDGAQLVQTLLHSKPKDDFRHSASGMLLDLRPADYLTNHSGTIYSRSADAAANAVIASNPISTIYAKKAQYLGIKKVGNDVWRCAVPLSEMFPWLKMFSDGCVYLGMGQALVANAQINPVSAFVNARLAQAVAPTFSISNAVLVKVYSQLDSERQSLVLRSSIPLQKIDYLNVKQPMAASSVLNYNVAEKQRVKSLYITHFWNKTETTPTANTHCTVAANASARMFADPVAADDNTITTYKNVTGYFPALHRILSLLQISFGGQTRVFNLQQIQMLAETGAVTGHCSFYADDQLPYYMKSVLKLDLSRMITDLIGSSTGNQIALQVTLNYSNGVNKPIADGVSITDAQFNNFIIETFLESGIEARCENGIYKTI